MILPRKRQSKKEIPYRQKCGISFKNMAGKYLTKAERSDYVMKDGTKSEFKKVFGTFDILVIAFGAMIGWGWVVSAGDWIMAGGTIGAIIGFVVGGIMILFVGLACAELMTAMPQCGGPRVFSLRAMGPVGAYICTWAIILGYVSAVCFEACALPTIIAYISPGFLRGYMYTIAGFDIYASWVVTAVAIAAVITFINIRGAEMAATLQTVLTIIIGVVGILLTAASAINGDISNLESQLLVGNDIGSIVENISKVAVVTPFFFIGFDVIPQAAEEINVPLKKIGRLMLLSILMAIIFYGLVIFSVGYVMSPSDIQISQARTGLVTADAMAKAFSSDMMSKVLIIGGICGIITSWNAFLIGGSRAMYSMAESCMLPRMFAVLHKKYRTPYIALGLIGILSMIAPFFGRQMIAWVINAGNFGCCVSYCMVALSFLILRWKEPSMGRPYKVKHHRLVGTGAVVMAAFMGLMYIIPGTGSTLSCSEWIIVGGWILTGVVFFITCRLKYKERFAISGSSVDREKEQR